jgi:hypothetical protein
VSENLPTLEEIERRIIRLRAHYAARMLKTAGTCYSHMWEELVDDLDALLAPDDGAAS